MDQEPREGALSRVEAAELPELQDPMILFPAIDIAADNEEEVQVPFGHQNLGIHNAIPDAGTEAHEAVVAGLPDVIQPLDAAALESELATHQVLLFNETSQWPKDHQESDEHFYDFSDSSADEGSEDDQDPEPSDINMYLLVDSPEPAGDNMDQNSEPAAGDTNMTDQITESAACDINMMDQNPESPAGDIKADHVDDRSVPAGDIDIYQYSEPGTNMMDLDSDTNVVNLGEFQSTVLQELQTHNPLVAETANERTGESVGQVGTSTRLLEMSYEPATEEGVVESPTDRLNCQSGTTHTGESVGQVGTSTPRLLDVSHEPTEEAGVFESPIDGSLIEFNRFMSAPMSILTVVPSPPPSSRLQPSSSPLTICESILEPNHLITTIRSSKSLD